MSTLCAIATGVERCLSTPRDRSYTIAVFYDRKGKGRLILYVIRVSHGKLINSRPCTNCIRLMRAKGVHRVYYSTATQQVVMERVESMMMTHESIGNIMVKSHRIGYNN